MKKYNTVTVKPGERDNYAEITSPYTTSEYAMLDNVIRDMQGCDYQLREVVGGIAVFRKKSELNTIE
jgi:hypothetical protein